MDTERALEEEARVNMEASQWFARMCEPAGCAEKSEFAFWLSQDPKHVSAYLEICEVERCLRDMAKVGERVQWRVG